MHKLILMILAFVSTSVLAEVTASGDNGFNIRIERAVPVSADVAYQQFIRINEWWISDHTWFGDAQKLLIQPKAGGCFCEIAPQGQVLHMLVTYVSPGREIRMTGGLGPLQMMGVYGGMSWTFKDLGNNNSQIIQSYNVTGFSPDGFQKLAEIVNKVQSLQTDALIKKLSMKK
ncbi:MAG: SRPBCC domain-containing protein [bacterium]